MTHDTRIALYLMGELGAALDEMDLAGAFVSVEVDDASLDALLGTGNEDVIGWRGHQRGC